MTEPPKETTVADPTPAPVPPAARLAIQPHPDAPEPCPLDHSCEEGEQCGCWCELHDCPIANCPSYKLVTAWLDDARRAGVAAGRTAAATDIRKTHAAWARTGKLPQSYLDGVADAAGIADEHAEGADHAG